MSGVNVLKSAAYEDMVEQVAEAGGISRHQARAVLKVLGHVDVSTEARLFGYRCEVLRGYAANREEMLREWTMVNLAEDVTTLPFADWLATKADAIAHAQLARETEVALSPLGRLALQAADVANRIGSKHSTQYGGLPGENDLDDDLARLLHRSVAGHQGKARRKGLAELAAQVLLALFLCECKDPA